MSRETDSPYPPGNEPDEPKTETTLTTRVRINIPGSRPIPPVVMRTPVGDGEAREGGVDSGERAEASTPDNGSGRASASGSRETSSWFAPRKPPTPPGGTPTGQVPPAAPAPPPPPPPPPRAASDPPAPPPPSAPSILTPPAGPTSGPGTGDMPLLPPEFRMNEEPQAHAQAQQPPAAPPVLTPPPERLVSDTLASGIPVVPSAEDEARIGAFPTALPPNPAAPEFNTPEPAAAPAFSDREPPAKKGRSKLMLFGATAVGVLGIAYGAGLLLDHADVPNGTTVLGVDIGGSSKQEAVNKLNAALGDRVTQPLTIDVGGTEKELKPRIAGLALDTETTVRNASGRDYNPISVIGSLVGGSREAEPAFKVDDEKLKAALRDLTSDTGGGGAGGTGDTGGTGGAAGEGMVKFENGKAIAVPGKAYMAVDADKSATEVDEAYRERAATGKNAPITLPVTKQEPKVTEQEIQRAIKEFGEPAMSGLVTVKAGNASISFSPEKSLPKFLSMRPLKDGKLVDHYDLDALKALYGSVFDGVKVTRGDGSRTPVTPEDVAGALRLVLTETDPAKRVGVIELDPR
ncbi:hypothetical protein [Streptomyces gobiensis]|uniref:hypothetical protein n=1 Tax=Streptomyces gobiensis TaxID=2875706 RepID=UPI001E5723FB|nr:hypothetical protein [Streptomyces gobiensis]UGY93469.1 hypothetical protein test1122_18235 [Streptomyces gobiensis]